MTNDYNIENMSKEQLLSMITTYKKLHSLIIRTSIHDPVTQVTENDYLLWADLIKKIIQLEITIFDMFYFSTAEKPFIADVIKTAKDFGVVRSRIIMAHRGLP